MSPSELLQIAGAIHDRFPKESVSTYYIRSVAGSLPSGKLHGYVTNSRSYLKKNLLIAETTQTRERHVNIEPIDATELQNAIDTEDIDVKKEFWKKSLATRQLEVEANWDNYVQKYAIFFSVLYVS